VQVQRWTRKRPRSAFENGERPACIPARNLDNYIVSKYMNRPTLSGIDRKGFRSYIRLNRCHISLHTIERVGRFPNGSPGG